MRNQRSFSGLLIYGVVAFFLIGYVIYPLSRLFPYIDWAAIRPFFTKPDQCAAVVNSVVLSVLTVLGSAIIGTALAYVMHLKRMPFQGFFSAVLLMPLALPPMVGVMSYLFLFSENGLLYWLFGYSQSLASGYAAILIVHLFSFYPLFYVFIGNRLKSIDHSVIEASHMLGAGKTRTFFRVLLPLLFRAMISAALLTFMASMASFSAPFLFGGSMRFLTTDIYYAKINGDLSTAATASLLLVLFSGLFLAFFTIAGRSLKATAVSKGTRKAHDIIVYQRKPRRTAAFLFVFCGLLLLPVGSLVFISLMPEGFLMQPDLGLTLSFDHYQQILQEQSFFEPLLHSVYTSTLAVGLSLIVGLLIASISVQKKGPAKHIVDWMAVIPYGIPGTVIGLCLIMAYNQPTFFSFNTVLVGHFWILPIAYLIRNVPVMTQAIRTGWQGIDPTLQEASLMLGASPWKTAFAITLPLLLPSMLEGGLLVFINAFGEFVATVLLYTPSTKTMPIELYAQLRMNNYGMAAAYGVILFVLILLVIGIVRRLVKRNSAQQPAG
ncbi:MAG: ABC transporter permease [Ferruginibacter sp.]